MANTWKLRGCFLFACCTCISLAYGQRNDSTILPNLHDSILDTGVVRKVKKLAETEITYSRLTYKEGRISIAQRRTIDAIKTTSQHVKLYLKDGLDTSDIESYLRETDRDLEIAKDGVFTNQGTTQTQRNLSVTASIVAELLNNISNRKIQLDKYTNNLIAFKDKLDSLATDSSLYYLPQDSGAIIKYAKRLSVVNMEIGPVDSSLRIAVASAQDLQLKLDLMIFELRAASDGLESFAAGLSNKVFNREVPNLWDSVGNTRPVNEIFEFSKAKVKMVLSFYVRENRGPIFLILLLIIIAGFFLRSVKKLARQQKLLNEDFAGQEALKYPWLSSVFIVLTIFQFIFLKPPFIFNFCIWSVSLLCLTAIARKAIAPYWRRPWFLMIIFFLLASGDNLFLQASRPERWLILALAAAGALVIIYTIFAGRRRELRERGLFYFFIFVAIVESASFLLNLFGRYNISKSFMVTGYTGIAVAILFFWTVRLIKEILGLTHKIYKIPDRKLFYIDFEKVGTEVPGYFYVFLVIGWFIIIGRNYYIFKAITDPIAEFFVRTRTVGHFAFSISSIFVFFAILIGSTLLSKVVSFFATSPPAPHGTAKGNRVGIGSWLLLVRIFIISLGLFLAFAATGIPIDRMTIIFGALGVGVGFGLQSLVANLVSGLIIAFEKPVNVGDLLEVNGRIARMKSIGFRSSIARFMDGSHVVIPNGDVLNQHLVNWSMGRNLKRSIVLLGVAYGTDIEQAKKLFTKTLEETDGVLMNPAPGVIVKNLGPYSIDFELSFWVNHVLDADPIKSDVISNIDGECKKAGIVIPVPQQDITIRSTPSNESGTQK